MLEVRNVVKIFDRKVTAVDDVSLSLKNGVLGLIGHNGAGKTTLMQMIATLTRPSSGQILFQGTDIAKNPNAIRARLGFLPQDFGVYPNLTALEFMQYFAALKGINDSARIRRLLDLVNLQDHANRQAASFSGGMRRRLGIAQALIPDPRNGMTLMAVKGSRVLYTSSAMAFGSATLASVLMGLGSFYLVRGRVSEDLRSGIASVIAATGVTNAQFLLARWLGGVLYMLGIVAALMCTTIVLHGLRGEGPIEPVVYLQTYGILLVPTVFFGVSVALLFDSVPFLMGKVGDVLYFFLWMLQFGAVAATQASLNAYFPALFMLDVSGVGIAIMQMQHLLGTTSISVGVSEFNAAAPIFTLPSALWNTQIMLMRFVCALLATAPILPALLFFHRYSPDRVKIGHARARRSPLAWLNSILRPLARLVRPLFRLASLLPNSLGQVLAEVTLTLMTAPAAIAALLVSLPAAYLVAPNILPWVMLASVAFWGILISGLSTRDFEANLEEMTGVQTGATGRYLRQLLATGLLGLMFVAVGALRWAEHAPLRAAVLIFGVLSLSAIASLLGRTSRTARTFVALFLFGLYIITNARDVPLLDWLGSNGIATGETLILQITIAVFASLAGIIYSRQQAH